MVHAGQYLGRLEFIERAFPSILSSKCFEPVYYGSPSGTSSCLAQPSEGQPGQPKITVPLQMYGQYRILTYGLVLDT